MKRFKTQVIINPESNLGRTNDVRFDIIFVKSLGFLECRMIVKGCV